MTLWESWLLYDTVAHYALRASKEREVFKSHLGICLHLKFYKNIKFSSLVFTTHTKVLKWGEGGEIFLGIFFSGTKEKLKKIGTRLIL